MIKKLTLVLLVIASSIAAINTSCTESKKPAKDTVAVTPTNPTTPTLRQGVVLCRNPRTNEYHLNYFTGDVPTRDACAGMLMVGWMYLPEKKSTNEQGKATTDSTNLKEAWASINVKVDTMKVVHSRAGFVWCNCSVGNNGASVTVRCPMSCSTCCEFVRIILANPMPK